jgi:hypothetical protein
MIRKSGIHFHLRCLTRLVFWFGLSAVAGCLALSTAARASAHDPADYTLRTHILTYTSHSRHACENKNLSDGRDYVDGMGQADLLENGDPRGFGFTYSCMTG